MSTLLFWISRSGQRRRPTPVVVLAVWAIAGLGAGCQSASRGTASIRILPAPREPTASARSKGQAAPSDLRVVSVDPYPRRELVMPAYPHVAQIASAAGHTVFITFTIDTSGDTTDVHRSIARVELPDRFSAAFDAAAIAAVRQWQFEPARLVYWRTVPGKDDQYVGAETTPVTFEVQFTFDRTGRMQ